MQFVSHNSLPSSAPSWYGLAAAAVAIWLSRVACRAQSLPTDAQMLSHVPATRHWPVVDDHPIQPRADEFSERHSQLDVSDRDARELDKIYDKLMRRSHQQCLSADCGTLPNL